MAQSILSPIALSVRDQTVSGTRPADLERVGAVCREVLDANTQGVDLGSSEMKATVASIVEGVLASLAASRTQVVEATMHAIARYASSREGADPRVVAAVICDAASVIEVSDEDQPSYLEATVEAVLKACDHLLGPERDEFATFLRSTLPVFLQQRRTGVSDEQAHREPDAS